MKSNSYSDGGFLNNYGINYTSNHAPCPYIAEIIAQIIFSAFGTIIDTLFFRPTAKGRFNQTTDKMGESRFKNNIDLNRTIKHGAILYIVIALLAVPVGICSTQHHSVDYVPPVVTRSPAPAELLKDFESLTFSNAAEFLIQEIARLEAEAALAALPPFYQPIMKAAQAYEVDAALIRAIIMAESSNNPKAVSHRGAQGLMQLMPTTARSLGVEDAFNPELNIDGGVRYLKSLLNRFDGDVKLALAAYNAGSRYVHKYGGVPPFRATRVYIQKVLHYRQMYQNEMAVNETGGSMV